MVGGKLAGRLGVRPGGDGGRRQSGDGLVLGGDLRDRLANREARPVVGDARQILAKTVLRRVDNNGKLVLSTKKKDGVVPERRDRGDRQEEKGGDEETSRKSSYGGDHCDRDVRDGGKRRSLDGGARRSMEGNERSINGINRDQRRSSNGVNRSLNGVDRGGKRDVDEGDRRRSNGFDRGEGRSSNGDRGDGRRSNGVDRNGRRNIDGDDKDDSMDVSKSGDMGDLRSRLGKNDRGGNKRKAGSESYDDLLQSAMGKSSRQDRSRSPVERKPYDKGGKSHKRRDYDDPQEAEEAYVRTINNIEKDRMDPEVDRTLAGKLDSEGNFNGVSPLQGSKVVVTNLQESVTQDDIEELFLDMGALKRVKMENPGSAEVTYVARKDAEKSVERYNNVTLDGKSMKCRVVGLTAPPGCGGATLKLPASLVNRKKKKDADLPEIEIESVHKALFRKKGAGQKLLFATIEATSAKKSIPWLPEDIVNAMVNSRVLNL